MEIAKEIAGLNGTGIGGWRLNEAGHLEKEFTFPDFASALAFTNRLGAEAEEQGHHPDLALSWGKVRVEVWTHSAKRLTEKDFLLARAADRVL